MLNCPYSPCGPTGWIAEANATMHFSQQLSVLAVLASSTWLAGCGGDDSEPTGTGKPGPDDWGTAAMPCNISTGYPGDELCILPPPEGTGFQLHYGPSSYDQAEINKFLLMPGDERTDCIFVDTPNQTEVFFNEYHGRMRPGSHHMLLYLADADVPDTNT